MSTQEKMDQIQQRQDNREPLPLSRTCQTRLDPFTIALAGVFGWQVFNQIWSSGVSEGVHNHLFGKRDSGTKETTEKERQEKRELQLWHRKNWAPARNMSQNWIGWLDAQKDNSLLGNMAISARHRLQDVQDNLYGQDSSEPPK
jgi:hypothetical protein